MRFSVFLILGAILLAAGGCAGSSHIEPYRDVSCFAHAKVSLSAAIEAARNVRTAQIIDAEYNCDEEMGCLSGNPGRYDVTYVTNGRLDRVSVCAATGIVGPPFRETGMSGVLSMDAGWSQSEMLTGATSVAAAPVTLLRAIAIAEAAGPKAMAAHVKTSNGKTDYVLELVEHGRVRMVYIDPNSGSLRN